jgi:hypothetical protein
MSYLLSELSGPVLKKIFDDAFLTSRLDDDGDLIVEIDGLKTRVMPDAPKDLFKLFAVFGNKGDYWKLVGFCNRYNNSIVMVRAQVLDRQDSDGDWIVVFDYDRFMLEDERIDARQIVTLAQKFTSVVRGGIAKADTENLF